MIKELVIKLKDRYNLFRVRRNSFYIRQISNPSEEMQMAAVQSDFTGHSIRHIDNPTERVQMYVIEKWSGYIIDIDNPTELVQLKAIEQNPFNIYLIKKPTELAKVYAELLK